MWTHGQGEVVSLPCPARFKPVIPNRTDSVSVLECVYPTCGPTDVGL